ncbi:hypothetical protein BH09ACT1_BH09ACT1_01350 [soil metagenome]
MEMSDVGGMQLHATLSEQLERIRALEARLDRVFDSLPRAATGVWRGPAHRAYVRAIDELRSAVARAVVDVERAAASTRRAVSKVASGA